MIKLGLPDGSPSFYGKRLPFRGGLFILVLDRVFQIFYDSYQVFFYHRNPAQNQIDEKTQRQVAEHRGGNGQKAGTDEHRRAQLVKGVQEKHMHQKDTK